MKRALTIAGSDSGGGAGIQADLKTFAAFSLFGMSAVTAVTAQNTQGVRSVHPVPPRVVSDQIFAVLEDLGADAVKTGMLHSAPIVLAVAEALRALRPPHVVVDPVMISKSGAVLLEADAQEALAREILPLCEVVTPNLPEAEVLCGRRLETPEDRRGAATALLDLGPRWVLLKGGHGRGDVVDLLVSANGERFEMTSERIRTRHTHGTGCTLSAALAAGLARGMPVPEAVEAARDYVLRAIREAPGLGKGAGPLHHGAAALRAGDSDDMEKD